LRAIAYDLNERGETTRNDCREFAAAVRRLLKENKNLKFTRVYLAHVITRVDVGKSKIRMRNPKTALAEQAIAFDSTKLLVPTFDVRRGITHWH
jgi:histidinol phosphatase-like enzyme